MLTFLMKYERLEFVEAVEMLARDMGMEVPREQGRGPVVRLMRTYIPFWSRRSASIAIICGRLRQWIISRVAGYRGNCPGFWHRLRTCRMARSR